MKPVHCSWVDMQKIRDFFDGSVPLAEWHSLPDVPATYLAFFDESPLYAGMTARLRTRWKAHVMKPLMRSLPGASIAYRLTPTPNLRDAERELIRAYRPLLQRSGCLRGAPDILAALRERIVYLNAIRERAAAREAVVA